MVVRAFSRHLTLVRPLGEAGKLRIAADMAHFELALEPLLHAATKGTGKLELSDLGAAYTELRSLRQLLFVEVRERSQPPRARASCRPRFGALTCLPAFPFARPPDRPPLAPCPPVRLLRLRAAERCADGAS